MNHHIKSAFTLIELLVVIAIIALLVSILLPSLNRAKDLAKRVVCSSRISGLGKGIILYGNDFDSYIPLNTNYAHPNWDYDENGNPDGSSAERGRFRKSLAPYMGIAYQAGDDALEMHDWLDCPATGHGRDGNYADDNKDMYDYTYFGGQWAESTTFWYSNQHKNLDSVPRKLEDDSRFVILMDKARLWYGDEDWWHESGQTSKGANILRLGGDVAWYDEGDLEIGDNMNLGFYLPDDNPWNE